MRPELIGDRLAAIYGEIQATAMRGAPICNDALGVEAIGVRDFAGDVLGVIVTPCFLNLVVAEQRTVGASTLPTEGLRLRFPAGDVDFTLSELKGFGRLASCSLFSPMSEFLDQQAARAAATRLVARMIDLAEGLDRLRSAAAGEETDPAEPAGVSPAPREGFAAVETSRGRLCHWTRLSRDGIIDEYAIVAPTEWNFHPAGPFVLAVLGARAPRAAALASIARLAGLFDACVPYRVQVLEPAHA